MAIREPETRARVLRAARTFLLLCAAGGGSASAITSSGVRAAAGAGGISIAPAARASTVSRSRSTTADTLATVRVDIDGLPTPLEVRTGSTVAEALARLGIALGPADVLSLPADTPLAEGAAVVLDRGIPVTLVDGGIAAPIRTREGTVAGLLSLYGIVLGPKDILDRPTDATIAPGDVVRITRVAEREVVQVVPSPFAVHYQEDATADAGTETVARPGMEGETARTYLVRYVDGVEASRTLVASTRVRAPVDELRVKGTSARIQTFAATPVAPGNIQGIIIAAAARWGVSADQLLRVASCESGFNPNAYNGVVGASGLFQIIPGTWAANSARAGYGGASVFDPVANANVAAYMFSTGQAGQWVCK